MIATDYGTVQLMDGVTKEQIPLDALDDEEQRILLIALRQQHARNGSPIAPFSFEMCYRPGDFRRFDVKPGGDGADPDPR